MTDASTAGAPKKGVRNLFDSQSSADALSRAGGKQVPAPFLQPYLFLTALFAAHTVLLIAYGQLEPERMRIKGPDAVAYYAYFHSLYFDHDLDFANQYDKLGEGFAGYDRTPTGLASNHSSCGPAIALAPFWIAADVAARIGHWTADGTSTPYHLAAFIGLGFYGWLTLMLLGAWTMREFGRWPGAWGAAVAWGATPLLYYCYPMTLEPHAVGAFGATLLLVVAQRRKGLRGIGSQKSEVRSQTAEVGGPATSGQSLARWTDGALVGLALGWAMLCRWQNFLFVMYPLALSLRRLIDSADRRRALRGEVCFWAAAGGAAVAAFLPQMIAWQALYGWPLGAPQEKGYFNPAPLAPFKVLFSPHNGLFAWTPAAGVGVAGLLFAARGRRGTALALGAIFVAQIAVNSAVWDWFGAWGFSSRRFTESAGIFAFGWSALFARMWGRGSQKPKVRSQKSGERVRLGGNGRWRILPIAAGLLFVAFTEAFVYQFYFHLIKWNGPLTAHELYGDKLHLGKSYYRRLSVEQARRLAEAGDYTRAWDLLEDAKRLDPHHDDIYEMMGFVSEMSGDLNGAYLNFSAALEMRPEDAGLIADRERVLDKMKEQ